MSLSIYQENRSFDSYFGTFPGADNLATAEARAHGFRQYDAIGKDGSRRSCGMRRTPQDADHSRTALIAKSDHGRMDKFVDWEETNLVNASGANPQFARQVGLLTMAHQDCGTVPFLWMYAHRFALYDHIFQAMYGPSTPGNIDLIAGQTGQSRRRGIPRRNSLRRLYATGRAGGERCGAGLWALCFSVPDQGSPAERPEVRDADALVQRRQGSAEGKVDTDDVKDDIGELGG